MHWYQHMSGETGEDDAVTLLEFAVSDPTYPFVAASKRGGEVTLEEMLPRGDGGYGEFFSVRGCPPADLVATSEDDDIEVEADVLVDREDNGLVEFVVGENCPAVALAEAGALPRTVEATDGEGTLVAEVPADADAAEITDQFLSEHPTATLERKAQQSYATPLFSPRELESALDEELTERQREVLLAAHDAGYYDWPRDTSGQELADEFGLAPPTLHDHLRSAERKLVSLVVEAGGR